MTPNPSENTMANFPLEPDCIHCQNRLSSLERVTVEHASKLLLQDQRQDALERKLDKLGASNERIEVLLERVLAFVTPSSK